MIADGLPDNFIKYVWKSGDEAVKTSPSTSDFLGEEFGLESFRFVKFTILSYSVQKLHTFLQMKKIF